MKLYFLLKKIQELLLIKPPPLRMFIPTTKTVR